MNSQSRVTITWLLIGLLAITGIFLPSMLGMDMMGGGYAIAVVSALLLIAALIVAVVYWRRGVALNAIVSGDDRLAHWHYDSYTWAQHVDRQFDDACRRNRSMFLLLAALCLGVGVLFAVVAPEGGGYVLATMVAVTALCGLAAFIAPRLQRRANRTATPEAHVGRRGAVLGSDFHLWRTAGTRVEAAAVETGGSPRLVVTYSAVQRHGRQEYVVGIPVPRGEEGTAAAVARVLRGEA